MFKRICISFMTIFMAVSCYFVTSAYESENVFDYLEYLTEDQVSELQGTIDTIAAEHNLDVVIVITDDTEGKSSMEYADDYYDYNGFGYDDEFSGILMLINMDEREVWFSTTGKAIRIFTDYRISLMVDYAVEYLGDADYIGCSQKFLSNVDFYADLDVPSNQHTVNDGKQHYYGTGDEKGYFDRVLHMLSLPFVYIVTLAISVVVTLLIASSSKGKVTTNNKTYEAQGTFKLTVNNDVFINETITKTRIESSSGSGSGGGRSSTHFGSSGRSHGGGGGKF